MSTKPHRMSDDRTISIGSVIHGTTLPADLLPALANEVDRVLPGKFPELIERARSLAKRIARSSSMAHLPTALCGEEAAELINELADTLDSYAPDYHRFGVSEGDGSDWGWWPDYHRIDELKAYKSTEQAAARHHIGGFKVVDGHKVDIFCRFNGGKVKHMLEVV